jgi:hypothetical protein
MSLQQRKYLSNLSENYDRAINIQVIDLEWTSERYFFNQ